MSNFPDTSGGRSRDIDISKPGRPHAKPSWLWLVVIVLISVFLYLTKQWHSNGMLLLIVGLIVFAFVAWVAWILIVRRGILTWGRLGRAPARALARGDKVEAERALTMALERARQFAPHDHRRGLMFLELAAYVKDQGRYPDAKELFEECIDIFAQRWRSNPMDYFVALNNYAVYLIDVRDFAAAQNTLEKVLDLALFWKKGTGAKGTFTEGTVHLIESCLHLNLAFLFVQMDALTEAADHLAQVGAILPKLGKRQRTAMDDHYCAVGGLLLFAKGRFTDAAEELSKARNRDYPPCLYVRAKLHLVAREFSQAEQLLRRFFELESKKGSEHRPGFRDHTLDLAEGLFGQGKYDDAFSVLQEARAIAADFALPVGKSWHKALTCWSKRAKELGRTDVLGSLEADLQQLRKVPEEAITISTRLRVREM